MEHIGEFHVNHNHGWIPGHVEENEGRGIRKNFSQAWEYVEGKESRHN